MQIIIDVLAGIGFLTVLGFIWVAFELLKESRREKNAIPLRIWYSVDKSINIMGERGNTPPGQAGEHENYGKNGLRYGSHVYDKFF